MDNLILDPEVLLSVADIIKQYGVKQKETINTYYSNIMALNSEWQDDETFSSLMQEVRMLKSSIYSKMEMIEIYADAFRQRAETIEQRPSFGQTGNFSPAASSTSSAPHSGSRSASAQQGSSTAICLMAKKPLDSTTLTREICEFDGVRQTDDYVKISSNGRRINDLDAVGPFLSPVNGEKIYCTRIAWRCEGVGESTSQNVCGAEFCYKDGSFCGSYVGKDWQEIFENNRFDTKQFRD